MEEILRMTLEIIRLLIGQEDFVVKKSGDSIIIEPPPHSPERNDEQRILDLANKMIELLTGERLVTTIKDVIQKDHQAVCSSPDESDFSSRLQTFSPGHNEGVISENEQTFSGDITVRLGSRDQENLEDGDLGKTCVKIEPNGNNKDHICPMYGMEVSLLNIKEESFSGDEGAFTEADVSTSINIKEESFSIEEIEYTTNDIKEESSSGGEGILSDTDLYSAPSHMKVKPIEQEHLRDMDVNTRLSTSVRKKPGRKLNPSQIVEPNADGMYFCRDCRKCYPTNSRLIKHQRVHRVKTIPCLQCGKHFSCNSALTRHQTAHTEEKPFTCSECGKCMSSKAALLVHYRVHKGVKPFVCSDCGQQFLFKSHLVRHQIKHTGEKPFSCSECGKSYSSKAAIVMHQRLHAGNTLHPCPECGKCFVQMNNLKQHMNVHTGEKPYACPECGKRFVQKSNLKQHLSVHVPKKKETFCCSECGKCYKRRADYRWHMLIHLGEK